MLLSFYDYEYFQSKKFITTCINMYYFPTIQLKGNKLLTTGHKNLKLNILQEAHILIYSNYFKIYIDKNINIAL